MSTSSVGYYRSCSFRAVWHRRASTYRRTSRTANVVACRNSLGERCRYLTPTAAPPRPTLTDDPLGGRLVFIPLRSSFPQRLTESGAGPHGVIWKTSNGNPALNEQMVATSTGKQLVQHRQSMMGGRRRIPERCDGPPPPPKALLARLPLRRLRPKGSLQPTVLLYRGQRPRLNLYLLGRWCPLSAETLS